MQAHPDGCPDGLALPAAASLDQLPWDGHPEVPSAWDALAGAHLAVVADAPHPDLPDVDAERSVDLGQDGRELGG